MKKYILILFLLLSAITSAQKSLNDYKYVIVPVKYAFLSEENQYRLNTLTKFNLTKVGFVSYYDTDKLPDDIVNNKCDKLYVDVEKVKAFLLTKLVVVFRDCQNNVVYKSAEGKSKDKEYKIAYTEALNEAFQSLYGLGYTYNGKDLNSKFALKTEPATVETPKSSPAIAEESKDLLFAQPIPNGYQLVDKTPKVVLKIFKTSQPDYFTAQSETINGAVIKKNGEWILEYYKDDKPVSEKLLIKF